MRCPVGELLPPGGSPASGSASWLIRWRSVRVYKHVVALRSQEYTLTIRHHRRVLSIVLSLVILAVAGCSSAAAAGGTRITLGFSAWPGWLPWQVAQAEGLF